ncbi:MAG: metallophosphoesterase family protein [Burkholderiales bacterium]|nr:metallophosphoesterase family protein [Burkholderiales bacterium]
MRIALLSDIHGNLLALEAVLADLRLQGADRVANLGDNLSGPLLPRETAQCLMAQTDWIQLAGNHERQLLSLTPDRMGPSDAYARGQLGTAELEWLRTLPASARPAPDVLLCHGTPQSDLVYFLETVAHGRTRQAGATEVEDRLRDEAAALVACGHTHVPRAMRSRRGQCLVNPGSVGLQAYEDSHPEPHSVETGSTDARYAIVERGAGGRWNVTLRSVPYDHGAMARIAEQHGRPDWAHALRTGRAT